MRSAYVAFALAMLATPAMAEDYTLIIHESPDQLALRSDPGPKGVAYWAGYAKIGQALAQAGVSKGGAALDHGPATTGTDPIGGYFIIAVPDRATAAAWAAKIPAARVDVQLHIPAPTGM